MFFERSSRVGCEPSFVNFLNSRLKETLLETCNTTLDQVKDIFNPVSEGGYRGHNSLPQWGQQVVEDYSKKLGESMDETDGDESGVDNEEEVNSPYFPISSFS